MFRLGADLKVYLHREPIDFRAGINSLAVLVQETMALDPFAPVVFAFCNRIHPVKTAATSDLTVAFHSDDREKVFDAERGEGEHLDLGGAVDPDYAVFGLHADGKIMQPIDGFAQFGGDTIDGLDGMDLVQLHSQAA